MTTSNQQHLADTLVSLADTVVDDFDLLDYLGLLAEKTCAHLNVAAAAVVLSDQRGSWRPTATSDETRTGGPVRRRRPQRTLPRLRRHRRSRGHHGPGRQGSAMARLRRTGPPGRLPRRRRSPHALPPPHHRQPRGREHQHRGPRQAQPAPGPVACRHGHHRPPPTPHSPARRPAGSKPCCTTASSSNKPKASSSNTATSRPKPPTPASATTPATKACTYPNSPAKSPPTPTEPPSTSSSTTPSPPHTREPEPDSVTSQRNAHSRAIGGSGSWDWARSWLRGWPRAQALKALRYSTTCSRVLRRRWV